MIMQHYVYLYLGFLYAGTKIASVPLRFLGKKHSFSPEFSTGVQHLWKAEKEKIVREREREKEERRLFATQNQVEV